MPLSVRPIGAGDLGNVSRFLLRVHKTDGTPNFETYALNWKYLCERPDWPGSRGFVVEHRDDIAAFGGVLPSALELPNGECVKAGTLIDWAADPSFPGAGALIMRKVLEKTGMIFIIGGTRSALNVLSRMGFHQAGEVTTYSRWVHPCREFHQRSKTPRAALRLAHGWFDALRPTPRVEEDWESLLVDEFDGSAEPILNRRPANNIVGRRAIGTLNYMLKCPLVQMKPFLLRHKQSVVGYFIVGKTGWEGRLVDISLREDASEYWEQAYATATLAIMALPDVCRVFAWATVPPLCQALINNGFWIQDKKPLMIHDPRHLLGNDPTMNLQLLDGEAAFLLA